MPEVPEQQVTGVQEDVQAPVKAEVPVQEEAPVQQEAPVQEEAAAPVKGLPANQDPTGENESMNDIDSEFSITIL
jgi:hypothetical protein